MARIIDFSKSFSTKLPTISSADMQSIYLVIGCQEKNHQVFKLSHLFFKIPIRRSYIGRR